MGKKRPVSSFRLTGTNRAMLFFAVLFFTLVAGCSDDSSSGTYLPTAAYFSKIKSNAVLLRDFFLEMPKGADLHIHLDGAVWAESYIRWAAEDGLCIELNSHTITIPPCNELHGKPPASQVLANNVLYNEAIDAMSMRDFVPGAESGHDHFFNTFSKFSAVVPLRTGDMLAEVVRRAADNGVMYLEPIFPPGVDLTDVVNQVEYMEDYALLRERLIQEGVFSAIPASIDYLSATINKKDEILRCGTGLAHPGCDVALRFIPYTVRTESNLQVFAQFLFNSELVKRDSRFVSHDLVAPEDDPSSLENYTAQIEMLRYLRSVYPEVKITLHAGELWPPYAEGEDLTFHIRQAATLAGAERIGHGVDLTYEDGYPEIIDYLKSNDILVAILLTSNDDVLDISGSEHPFPLYLDAGVPVMLSTDDPGVERIDLTHEYVRATQSYDLSYETVTYLNHNGLQYSYLPGKALFSTTNPPVVVEPCRNDVLGAEEPTGECTKFLSDNDRASVQWELKRRLNKFNQKLWAIPTD